MDRITAHIQRKTPFEISHMIQQYQQQLVLCKPEGIPVLREKIAGLSRLVKGDDRP